jgi:site-specific DNA-methyltransferase (adenine-specific)
MKTMPDKSVDLVLADFPYGVGFKYLQFDDTQDNLKKLIDNAMPEILRIGKRVAITCGTKNMYLYPKPDWVLCWYCKSGTGMSNWGFCTWQPILVYGKDPYLEKCKGSMPDSFDQIETISKFERDNHPCAKPIDIWRKIIKRCSLDGIVFDPFLGSGTTARACKDLGRKWIGCEISKEYCDICVKRLEQEVLF